MSACFLTISPDAALLDLMMQIEIADREADRLGALFCHMRESDALYEKTKQQSDAADEIVFGLVQRACSIPARTEQGRSAKARLMQCFNTSLKLDGVLDTNDLFMLVAHSLSLDLAGPPLSFA
jgi:hypothetical protein